jgi:hypothetical protein
MPSRDLVPIAGNRSGFPSKARQQATNRQRLRPVSILLGYIRTSLLPAHSSIILPTLCRKPAEATSQRHPSGDALSSSCPQLLASMHISMFLATTWLSKTGYFTPLHPESAPAAAVRPVTCSSEPRKGRSVRGECARVRSASPHTALDLEHQTICAST